MRLRKILLTLILATVVAQRGWVDKGTPVIERIAYGRGWNKIIGEVTLELPPCKVRSHVQL